MNKIRRKELSIIYHEITELMERLEAVKDEEEEYRDNIPENLQASDRYAKADEAVSALEEAFDYLSSALDNIETVME